MSEREHPFELLKSWQEALTLMSADDEIRVGKLKGLLKLFPDINQPLGHKFYMHVDPALLRTEYTPPGSFINVADLRFEGRLEAVKYISSPAMSTISIKFFDLVLLDETFSEDYRPDDTATVPVLAIRDYVDLAA